MSMTGSESRSCAVMVVTRKGRESSVTSAMLFITGISCWGNHYETALAMARIDPLFELVRSLTKSEKRYFKLFAQMQGKDKKYLLLFDAIDRLEEYDED